MESDARAAGKSALRARVREDYHARLLRSLPIAEEGGRRKG
jgi:hypothetical protein